MPGSGLFLILFLLSAIAVVVWYLLEIQSTKDTVRTTLPASQILRQAVQEIGSERRYTATGNGPDFANFTMKRHANCGIAILLSFIPPAFILLGIIYMLVGNRTETLSVNVFPETDGTNSVQVSASGGPTKRRGKRFLRSLPVLPQLTDSSPAPAVAAPDPAALPPAQAVAAPQVAGESEVVGERALPTAAQQVSCEACGADMEASQRFCPSCGREQLRGSA